MLFDYSDRGDEISSMFVITRFTTARSEALLLFAQVQLSISGSKIVVLRTLVLNCFIVATLRKRGLPFMQCPMPGLQLIERISKVIYVQVCHVLVD